MTQYQTVWQLTFFPALFPVNCYLVEEENEVTLIDAALPGSYKGIIQAVNQYPVIRHGPHVHESVKYAEAVFQADSQLE